MRNIFDRSLLRHPLIWLTASIVIASGLRAETTLLNVSYDVTREFYKEYNPAFIAHWQKTTGEKLKINQAHGGSSKQVRSVIDGLAADIVTMNGVPDVDQLAKVGLIPANWASRLPNESVPYTSTILFIVRKGNPKKIKDWSDLAREGVSVVIPNPKTSGNGRYSYLGAWIYALKQPGGSESTARDFVARIFANVAVLDTGGRGASTTFAQRGIGDVLLTFENEVALTVKELGADNVEAVVPSASILAENPIVWIDKVVARKGTAAQAKAYLEYLYSPEAQELAAKYYFRPTDPAILAKYAERFPAITLYAVPEVLGSWEKAQKTHFADGGLFDQIYTNK
ncbi:MAG TPA: sulfate ABC transporter substrate-binding protein [Opitutus sp.]|nr:sulfate ABC transporter substrate-binding protein [Opitutus sp.]